MAYTVIAAPRGIPSAIGESRKSFGDALNVAIDYYRKGYEVQVEDQRTGQIYDKADLLRAHDRLRKAPV